MNHRLRPALAALAVCLFVASMGAQAPATVEPVDLDAVYRIKDEGFERSAVMEIASWLTDVHGPRLTGSPSIKAASDWAVEQLTEWGASNARLESWGTFGRGWVNERFSAHVVEGTAPWTIVGIPKAWTPGTDGAVTAEAIYAPLETDADLDKWKGKLKGKIVLPQPARALEAHFDAEASRYTAEELSELQAIDPSGPQGRRYDRSAYAFVAKRLSFLAGEDVAAVFEPGRRGDGGTIFVQQGGRYDPETAGYMRYPDPAPPQVVLAAEHYNRLVRVLEKNVPVTIELDIDNTITENQEAWNVLAELPGSDKADEVVMLGAHFDAWHGGTGATDNAAGAAVMMEAFRILKASEVPLRRTVRLALWTGEEQGLLGSRAYVKQHFADRETMALQPAHQNVSGYFNVDNGTGAIRGVYLQGNEAVAPILAAWMAPFANLGMTTLTTRDTGGTDHLAFDAVGIPGFQFIQDEVEYSTRTHHSNMDVWDRLQAGDLMKNAVIVASFVYHAANRDGLLPRKPLPKPQPSERRETTN